MIDNKCTTVHVCRQPTKKHLRAFLWYKIMVLSNAKGPCFVVSEKHGFLLEISEGIL